MHDQPSHAEDHSFQPPTPESHIATLTKQLAEAEERIALLEKRTGWLATPEERSEQTKKGCVALWYISSWTIIGAVIAMIVSPHVGYNAIITFGVLLFCISIPIIPLARILRCAVATPQRFTTTIVALVAFFGVAVFLFMRFFLYGSSLGFL